MVWCGGDGVVVMVCTVLDTDIFCYVEKLLATRIKLLAPFRKVMNDECIYLYIPYSSILYSHAPPVH